MSNNSRKNVSLTVAMAAVVTLVCLGSGSLNPYGAGIAVAQSLPGDAVGKLCEKLTVADVQPFFKGPVKKIEGCRFRTSGGHGAQLQILTGTSDSMFAREAMTEKYKGKPGVPLSGIGDKAIRQPGDVWVYAVKGGVFCAVQGGHAAYGAPDAASVEMRGIDVADVRAGNIPDAKAQPIAQKLGALCNKIFT